MDKSISANAAILLDFIGGIEAPRGYGTIFGNNQGKLKKPLTSMTLDEVIEAQKDWSKKYGSSASGRYQFMRATLIGLKTQAGLSGKELFSSDFQDVLGYKLLKRRGYLDFTSRAINRTAFGKLLAQEWASLPVLADCKGAHRNVVRGQSYYSGDGINKSLVKPMDVEAVLDRVLTGTVVVVPPPVLPDPPVSFWDWFLSFFSSK